MRGTMRSKQHIPAAKSKVVSKQGAVPMASRNKLKNQLAELTGDFTCLQERYAILKEQLEKEGIIVSAALDAAVTKFNSDMTALNTAVQNAASGASEQPAIDALTSADSQIQAAITALGGTVPA
jgi:hypothetical protein